MVSGEDRPALGAANFPWRTTSQAAWALGLGGAGQSLGRTLSTTLARHTGTTTRTVVLIVLGALTTVAFAIVPGPFGLLIAVSVVEGVVRGNLTILQAAAITDRWGTTHYGRFSGILSAPAMTASALAPSPPPSSPHPSAAHPSSSACSPGSERLPRSSPSAPRLAPAR